MIWKFELEFDATILEVDEPASWDEVVFSLKRQQFQHGLVFEYSSELRFYKEGRAFIQDIFDAYNIEAEIGFKAYSKRSKDEAYSLFYEGVLLMNQIKIDRLFAYVRVEQSGFLRALKATQDLDLEVPTLKEVILHSKTIKATSRAKINPFLANTATFPNNPTLAVPWEWQSSELPTTLTTSSFDQTQSIFFNEEEADVNVKGKEKVIISKGTADNINLEIRILVKTGSGATTVENILIYNASNVPYTKFEDFDFPGVGTTRIYIWEFDFTFDEDITMPDNSNLYYTLYTNINQSYNVAGNIVQSNIIFDVDEYSELEISSLTKGEPRVCQGIMLKDALNYIIEQNTFLADAITSDLLNTGCASNIFVTNGFKLRGLNEKPLFANFQDLWEATRKVFCAGISEQVDGLRIEEASYFYGDTELLECDAIDEPVRDVAQEWYFNKIDLGYKTWNDNAVGQINGLDEFNSLRQYDTRLRSLVTKNEDKSRKSLDLKVDEVVTSGYLIEYSRRQFGKETTDFKFDNTLFFICLNRDEVTSTLYTIDESEETYPALSVSERDENMSVLEGVIDPSTVYNVALSPRRILERWRPFLAACSVKSEVAAQVSEFRSGEGNYLMLSQGNLCIDELGTLQENQSLSLVHGSDLIFDAEVLSFEYPLSFVQFQNLRGVSGYVLFMFRGVERKGYITELNYRPNKGLASFKLLVDVI